MNEWMDGGRPPIRYTYIYTVGVVRAEIRLASGYLVSFQHT